MRNPKGDNICFACEHGYHSRCEQEFYSKGHFRDCDCSCDEEELGDDEQ